jgi:hypothetical protein
MGHAFVTFNVGFVVIFKFGKVVFVGNFSADIFQRALCANVLSNICQQSEALCTYVSYKTFLWK